MTIPQSPPATSGDTDGRRTHSPLLSCVAAVEFSKVHTAGTKASASGHRYREGRLQPELPSPRLCRESGGVTPTAQMTQVDGRKRAEVQGSAPLIKEGGRPFTISISAPDIAGTAALVRLQGRQIASAADRSRSAA